MVDGVGMNERGEVITDLATFAFTNGSYVWVTVDPAHLLNILMESYADTPAFNYQIVSSTEIHYEGAYMAGHARLTRFGFKCRCAREEKAQRGCTCGAPGRKAAMHLVWSPGDMSRNPGDYIDEFTHGGLIKFAVDVREWCSEQNLPLPTALSGIAASLIRDGRFWPHARGRVPRATNERVRPWLPGVYSELLATPGTTYHAVAIDQRTAYHRAAQEVATPDPTTMFARGYFNSPENSPIWAVPGDGVYERTMEQAGIVYVSYSARPLRKHEHRPPCIESGRHRAALWTNEVRDMPGVTIEGIIAAWTSCDDDTGLPLYGAWAQQRIADADAMRKRWLKPTLHAVYGLLAMRERQVTIGHYRGRGIPTTFLLGAGHEFRAARHDIPPLPGATTNVPMLGVLQSEIRSRSLRMASALSTEGVEILHIHADGIHVNGKLPLLPPTEWSIEPRTNLLYLDRVSWLADEGDTLPGRDERMRVEARRHNARLIRHLSNRPSHSALTPCK